MDLPRISVVIPTLREASTIAGAVESAFAAGAAEVIVADGGSDDATAARAIDAGARVTSSAAGRGPQLNAGASLASGDVLCFVHADVRLPVDAAAQIAAALKDPAVIAGNFRVRFGRGGHGRFLAAFYHVIRQLRLFYGDSALWVRRDTFERSGGFPPFPLMEDVAFAHRLMALGRVAYLPGPVEASPRRWVEGGLARTWASWIVIQTLYFYRVPPPLLARLYRHIR